MHEAHTRTGKITYTGGHTEDELAGVQIDTNCSEYVAKEAARILNTLKKKYAS